MGKGLLDYEDPRCARHGRAAVARLRARGLRGRRRRDHGRLRPRRALPGELEPQEGQEDRLHRHRLGRGRRVLHDRVRPDRRPLPHPHPPGRGAARRSARGRRLAPQRHHPRPLRVRQGRRRVPDAAAARAVGDPPGARPRRHADLRRRPAQAVDRAHVPGARAQHRPDRQRPRGHGDRAADRDRRQARPPRPQGGHGQRRRRLPHELPGARDGRAAARPRSST